MTSPSDAEPPTAASCAVCGAGLIEGTRFCRACGAAVDAASEERASGPGGAAEEQATTALRTVDVAATTAVPVLPGGRDGGLAPGPVGARLSSCPACTLANPDYREICMGCGVDLESGAKLPQPRPQPPAVPATNGSGPEPVGPVRHWWMLPVAAVAVISAIVLGMWLAGLGPFASAPELPAVEIDASRYPIDEDPVELGLSDIATVTTRPPAGDRVFHVEQMVDTDPETAWHSDPAQLPNGVEESVDLFLGRPAWLSQIVINNGDHRDADAYAATARIQEAHLVLDGGVSMSVNLLDLGRSPQVVELPEPQLTTSVRIEVVETFPGTDRDGVAMSDIVLRGWVADEQDAALAEERGEARRAAGTIVIQD